MGEIEKKIQIENQNISMVFGEFDSNIKKIEQACHVQIINRGDDIKIIGEETVYSLHLEYRSDR